MIEKPQAKKGVWQIQSIIWKRVGPTMKLYTEDGNELKMNPGNSFIEMLPSERVDTIKFE